MTIRPIPLDGLNRIHQFLLDRRVSGPDPYHDATMSDVKQLAEQFQFGQVLLANSHEVFALVQDLRDFLVSCFHHLPELDDLQGVPFGSGRTDMIAS